MKKFADLERKAGKENIIYLKNQMRIDASQATIDWLVILLIMESLIRYLKIVSIKSKFLRLLKKCRRPLRKRIKIKKMELVEWSQLLIGNIQEENTTTRKSEILGSVRRRLAYAMEL